MKNKDKTEKAFRRVHRTKSNLQDIQPRTLIRKPKNKRTGKIHQADVNKKASEGCDLDLLIGQNSDS